MAKYKVDEYVKVKHKGKTIDGLIVSVIDEDPWHSVSYGVAVGGSVVQKKEWEISK